MRGTVVCTFVYIIYSALNLLKAYEPSTTRILPEPASLIVTEVGGVQSMLELASLTRLGCSSAVEAV